MSWTEFEPSISAFEVFKTASTLSYTNAVIGVYEIFSGIFNFQLI
jgi:hypothetical protein